MAWMKCASIASQECQTMIFNFNIPSEFKSQTTGLAGLLFERTRHTIYEIYGVYANVI